MKSLVGVALVLALAGGCKKDPPATTTPGPDITDPKPVAGGLGFTLVELKLYLGEDLGLQTHTDGRIEENRSEPGKPPEWATIAKVTADGKLLAGDGSEAGALQADGSFKFAKGGTAPFKFVGATLVAGPNGERTISIDAKGVIQGGNDDGSVVFRVEGLTDEGSHRTALFALALALMGAQEGGAEGPPPPPAP